jgi:hypothetical protein
MTRLPIVVVNRQERRPTDAGAVRAAVGPPDVLKPRPEGAKLVVTMKLGDECPQIETFL